MSLNIPEPPVLDEAAIRRVQELKEEKDAIILAHNYQRPEVQDAADFLGDSFALAKIARELPQKNIIFCGVKFMAESAKILAPEKRVVLPDMSSRCLLAAMINPRILREWKARYPDAEVAAYINTTADVKAEVDICVTSSNAVRAVSTLGSKKVLFVPDENLGSYVQKRMPDREIVLYPGYCRSHRNITLEELRALKNKHPDAVTMAHPECLPEVQAEVDEIFSTSGMVNHVVNSDRKEFIVGTERELIYRIKTELWKRGIEGKKFYGFEKAFCPDMKRITLEKLTRSLETLEPVVELPDELIERARRPLDRMVAAGRDQ